MRAPHRNAEKGFNSSNMMKPIETLVIDGDASFRRLLASAADPRAMQIETYASLAEMGSFALIGRYDIAILDFHLPVINGLEIAEYIDVFFDSLPVVVIGAGSPSQLVNKKLPSCVRRFICKSQGITSILETASSLVRDGSQRLAMGYPS